MGSFVKATNATFIVLIPKTEGANDIKEFQPISLVGCIYKFISKEDEYGIRGGHWVKSKCVYGR